MSEVIIVNDRYQVDSLYQWDLNQELVIFGLSLSTTPEIHFTNACMDRAIVRQAEMDSTGVISVGIPNSLLQKPYHIIAYICAYENETFKSIYTIEIPVNPRKRPGDYTLENDEEIYSFNAIENKVSNLETNIEDHNQFDKEITQKYEILRTDCHKRYNDLMKSQNQLKNDINDKFKDIRKDMESERTYVTPEMFGAAGDGKTDDTYAILSAIHSFKGKAGKVCLKGAKYRISSPLPIGNHITLEGITPACRSQSGSGEQVSTIIYDGNEEDAMLYYTSATVKVSGGSIKNLAFDGNNKVDYIVDLRNSQEIIVSESCFIHSLKAAVYASDTCESIIEKNYFENNRELAIHLDAQAERMEILDNKIDLSNGSRGIYVAGCFGTVISGNSVFGGCNSSVGIQIASGSNQNIITNNRIFFTSERWAGQVEGICIAIGSENSVKQPKRTFVSGNSISNRIFFEKNGEEHTNHLGEFVDYGLGTVADMYDYGVMNQNHMLFISENAITGYNKVDNGLNFSQNADSSTIILSNATEIRPLIYQAIDVKDIRGGQLALSCMIKPSNRNVAVAVEFYKNGYDTWETKGILIKSEKEETYETGVYQLLQINSIVPDNCGKVFIVIDMGTDGTVPGNTYVEMKWLKLTRIPTWR